MSFPLLKALAGVALLLNSFLGASSPLIQSLTPVEISETASGLKGIDCIYVINLKNRPEKWETMQRELSAQGLKGNRVDAINGWHLSPALCKRLQTPSAHLNGGQIGCALSHLSVWKNALDRRYDVIWVLEDDVTFVQDASSLATLLAEMNRTDPQWDILYTDPDYASSDACSSAPFDLCRKDPHVLFKKLSHYTKRKEVSEHLTRIYGRWGLYSVLISRSGVQKLMEAFSSSILFSPIDHQIHTLAPSLRQYVLKKPVATQTKHDTSDTVANHFP